METLQNHASHCGIYHRYLTPCSSTMHILFNDLPELIEYVLSQTPFPWVNQTFKKKTWIYPKREVCLRGILNEGG